MPVCPVCALSFAVELPPRRDPPGRDTDFRPHHPRGDPDARKVFSCSRCRYSAYPRGWFHLEDSDDRDELDEAALAPSAGPPEGEELDALRRYVQSGQMQHGLDIGDEPRDVERFLLAARCYEFVREDDPLGAADYYLRASWCARAQGRPALERSCQADAISRYQTALEANKVTSMERPRILYLVGELSRRTGDFARAVDCFREVDRLCDPDEEDGAFLAALARRQEALAIVKSDVNAIIARDEEPE